MGCKRGGECRKDHREGRWTCRGGELSMQVSSSVCYWNAYARDLVLCKLGFAVMGCHWEENKGSELDAVTSGGAG